MTENELREEYIEYLKATTEFNIYTEVPVFSRSVDLVIEDAEKIMAVEMKLHDWKGAIEQLKQVSICFDYLGICMLKPKTEKCITRLMEVCRENGIGLVLYDNGTFETTVEFKKTHNVWNLQQEKIIEYLGKKKPR